MVAKRKAVHKAKKRTSFTGKINKAIDRFADKVAGKVAHELKEHEKHDKKCVCKSCKTKKRKR
jgi:hypothetical protein